MHMLDWWGFKGALQNRCEMVVADWNGLMKNQRWKKLWNLILGSVIWSLWYERNKSKFEMRSQFSKSSSTIWKSELDPGLKNRITFPIVAWLPQHQVTLGFAKACGTCRFSSFRLLIHDLEMILVNNFHAYYLYDSISYYSAFISFPWSRITVHE